MKKVILFGATGNLGKEIAKELVKQGYDLTAVVRNEEKGKSLSDITAKYIVADVCNMAKLKNILDKQEIVISALGKSVSPNDHSKPTYREVDYAANEHILNLATKAGIQKFIYVSAFHSEKYLHLDYFKVHHEFSELLIHSGIDYSIIKPPAIFSAFIDMIEMAKKGQLVNIGKGDKKTNPIYEGDLAQITVEAINKQNSVIEAGGKNIYTRKELNEIVQKGIDYKKSIKTVPLGLIKMALPILKMFSKNMYDKFAFFIEVIQQDTIAPQVGNMTFEDYIKMQVNEK
jgi:uncharacterized protein YbjT (DUF2867 family)